MKSGKRPPDKSKINLKTTYVSPTFANFIQYQAVKTAVLTNQQH